MEGASLRVICGPTAAGKSAIATDLAAEYGATIVSADSRQVYRGFDIGTAKPSRELRSRVPHCGIDTAEPVERYSAARWAGEADRWIGEAERSGRVPLIVGGTGLYIRSLVEPFAESPVLDTVRRERLAAELGGKSIAELQRWCEALDRPRAHLGRTQLLRSIETALLSGTKLSDAHARARTAPSRARWGRARYLVVDAGETSADRIARRAREMFDGGWVEEVSALMQNVPADAPAWKSAGYAAVRALAEGKLDLSSAVEKVIIETRQYAKRQRTWFRHQLPADTVTRLDPGGSPAQQRAAVREWWEKSE